MRVSRAVSFTLGKRGRVIWKRSLLSWTKKAGVDIFYFSNPTWIQNKKTVSFLNTMIFQNFVLMGLTYCNACWPIWRGFCQQKNAYVGFKSLCSAPRLLANKKTSSENFRRRFFIKFWISNAVLSFLLRRESDPEFSRKIWRLPQSQASKYPPAREWRCRYFLLSLALSAQSDLSSR